MDTLVIGGNSKIGRELVRLLAKLAAIATPEARAGRLTALHGLRTAEAALAWTREVEAMLLEEDSP